MKDGTYFAVVDYAPDGHRRLIIDGDGHATLDGAPIEGSVALHLLVSAWASNVPQASSDVRVRIGIRIENAR